MQNTDLYYKTKPNSLKNVTVKPSNMQVGQRTSYEFSFNLFSPIKN